MLERREHHFMIICYTDLRCHHPSTIISDVTLVAPTRPPRAVALVTFDPHQLTMILTLGAFRRTTFVLMNEIKDKTHNDEME